MMMNGMGGGIGSTMIMGWPLADWATIMLLQIVSIMVVAFLSSLLTFFQPWPERAPEPTNMRDDQTKLAPPRPEVLSK